MANRTIEDKRWALKAAGWHRLDRVASGERWYPPRLPKYGTKAPSGCTLESAWRTETSMGCTICQAPSDVVVGTCTATEWWPTIEGGRIFRCHLPAGHENGPNRRRGEQAHHGDGMRWWTYGNERVAKVYCAANEASR